LCAASRPARSKAEAQVGIGALTVRELGRSYGATPVLRGINLGVQAGEFLILVGPSGCGKSTLLNIIAGLDSPSTGQVLMDGQDITHRPSKDRDMAMVFQSYALYPNMTVAQNMAFGLEMRKVPKAQREATVQRVAAQLQIEPLLARKPAALSGGQRQRVAMGRALAREPKLFLFDEPLSNLDAKMRVEMRAEIKRLHQRTGVTTVYVTHDQVEAMTLGDRIAVMNGGVVEQLGSPEQIYSQPATRFVAQFIGSPAMNLLEVRANAAGTGVMAAGAPGLLLPLPPQALQALAHVALAGRALSYGIRPEDLSFADSGLEGALVLIEPTGPETYLTAQTALGALTVRVPGHRRALVGERVHLKWAGHSAHLFGGPEQRRLG
jgi:multiple sugar transport system ATP-binding protein